MGQQASSDARKREMSLVIVAAKSGILTVVPYDDTGICRHQVSGPSEIEADNWQAVR
jgi:peroxiredoxin